MFSETYNPLLRDDTARYINDLDDIYGTWFFYLFNLDESINNSNSYNIITKCYIYITTEVIYHNMLYHYKVLQDMGIKGYDGCLKHGYATRNAGIVYPIMHNTYFKNCKIIRN